MRFENLSIYSKGALFFIINEFRLLNVKLAAKSLVLKFVK